MRKIYKFFSIFLILISFSCEGEISDSDNNFSNEISYPYDFFINHNGLNRMYTLYKPDNLKEKAPLVFVMETLGCGTVNSRKVRPGRKKQWRWRCCFQDAYYSALLLQPYSHVKIEKINKIIKHYSYRKNMFNFDDKIIKLEDYRKASNGPV